MAEGNPFENPYAQQPAATLDAYAINPCTTSNNGVMVPSQQHPRLQVRQPPPSSPYQQPTQPGQQQGYDPFDGQGVPHQQSQHSNALVPSKETSIWMAAPQNQQNIQWQQAHRHATTAPGSYDPFAAPCSSEAIVPAPFIKGGNNYPGATLYPQRYQEQRPHQFGQQQHQPSRQAPPPPLQTAGPFPHVSSLPVSRPVDEVAIVAASSGGYPGAPSTPRQTGEGKESTTPTGVEARNKYSATLAQNAPLGASPLPRADMVRKTGYVLSRISFRTIVMKKWKQSFWVQYGPHTMLWFRSQADFDDWLNNPFHSQAQRNFLIKLAVNFAHDLYKPNVRGYQVTQCRTKSYGTKLIRQFKLERWMDYGPTIAAAFGSNNPKEVDDLREALVACMRNTPLNGGIRATGAVRERSEHGYEQHAESGRGPMKTSGGGFDSNSFAGHQSFGRPHSRSVASAGEMISDDRGFDDGNSVGGIPTGGLAAAPDLLDFPEPLQQQESFGQPAPSHYPPQPGQYLPQQYPPQNYEFAVPSEQQQYPWSAPPGHQSTQQQQPYSAQPQMQQQYNPAQGAPQVYGAY